MGIISQLAESAKSNPFGVLPVRSADCAGAAGVPASKRKSVFIFAAWQILRALHCQSIPKQKHGITLYVLFIYFLVFIRIYYAILVCDIFC